MGKCDYIKPTVLAPTLGAALKKVDHSYVFGQVQEDGLHQVGVGPKEFPADLVTLSSPGVLAMASDPAHGGKVSEGNIQEAVVGLMAQHLKAIPSLKRDPSAYSEFVEPSGQTWDVKSPFSPPSIPNQTWFFDASHHLDNVRHEVEGDENVLLDLSRCNSADSRQLVELMQHSLTPQEKAKVLVFYNVAP